MRLIRILTILCAFAPTIAVAQDGRTKTETAPAVRKTPAPGDVVAPGILRQDLFDRRNPNNLRHDYPAPPAQAGSF
ncbi:MAG: hypothetical protein ABSG88_18210 [Bradyrhizobium sp.]|jgi:hypothetical protein